MNDSPTPDTAPPPMPYQEHWIDGQARSIDERYQILQEYRDDYKPTSTYRLSAENDPILIERKIVSTSYKPPHSTLDYLIFTTGDSADTVRVHCPQEQLIVDINHERYLISPASLQQILVIRTRGGPDRVTVDEQVKLRTIVETADGDDVIHSEGAEIQIHAGPGDDFITTGAGGKAYVEAGEGNDMVFVEGDATVYGGAGNDHISATASLDDSRHLLNGGQGNDLLIGGRGHSILSGSDGDDSILAGVGTNTIYTGAGQDTVMLIKPADNVFSNDTRDQLFQAAPQPPANAEELRVQASSAEGLRITLLSHLGLEHTGLVVNGSPAFQDRVNDDLRLLGGSPVGSQLLSVLDKTARAQGIAVTINPLEYEHNALFLTDAQAQGDIYIRDTSAGDGRPGGNIHYNPAVEIDATPGLVLLYHELCHAYNRVTGTSFLGYGFDGPHGEKSPGTVPNEELQVIGLPAAVTPFDFDADPNTPALDSNPTPFTENGLREELGLAPRNWAQPR
ncbi:M91 family zinc metallopeptidase [Pseudomonas gingeri]